MAAGSTRQNQKRASRQHWSAQLALESHIEISLKTASTRRQATCLCVNVAGPYNARGSKQPLAALSYMAGSTRGASDKPIEFNVPLEPVMRGMGMDELRLCLKHIPESLNLDDFVLTDRTVWVGVGVQLLRRSIHPLHTGP